MFDQFSQLLASWKAQLLALYAANKGKIDLSILVTVFLFGMFVHAKAFAYDATVSWTNPTTNADGSAIAPAGQPGALTSTRVEYGTCVSTSFGTVSGQVIVNQPATATTISGFLAGQVVCYRAYARNTFGSESVASNTANKVFPTPTPNAPVLSSTITVAYDVKINSFGQAKPGRMVAYMPVGTPCLENLVLTRKQTKYYEIDRAAVTLFRKPRSSIVITKCEFA
jgi:hypothetical protein